MTVPSHYSDYTIKWTTLPWEVNQAFELRRKVFCEEQALFKHSDRDDIDDHAQILVAIGNYGGWHQQVVGTVRIHQQQPGIWYGSRLAVDSAFRKQGQLGATLIRLAVSSAHGMNCNQFLATVQKQNEVLFKRLNWATKDYKNIYGQVHAVMEADLSAYPPCYQPQSGFVVRGKKSKCIDQLIPESPWLQLPNKTAKFAEAI